jgi:hypothetical protein
LTPILKQALAMTVPAKKERGGLDFESYAFES